jgi:hypothetical protein
MTALSAKENTFADSYSKGITCTKCRIPVNNYDPGDTDYQKHYGPTLPAICDNCLNKILNKITSRRD